MKTTGPERSLGPLVYVSFFLSRFSIVLISIYFIVDYATPPPPSAPSATAVAETAVAATPSPSPPSAAAEGNGTRDATRLEPLV
jgi:hypothetical protein